MIAIKRVNGDLIWLDAVLTYDESYTSTVTKHQIESGSTVSDHITENNPTYSLRGVVSYCEFSNTRGAFTVLPEIVNANGEVVEVVEVNGWGDNEQLSVQINTGQTNPLLNLLPDSIRQFIGVDSPPEVIMGDILPVGTVSVKSMKEMLIELNRGVRKELGSPKRTIYEKELLTLVEFDYHGSLSLASPPIENCVCTSISFAEDPDSGDGIYPVMTFEQVRFVELQTTKLPQSVSKPMKNKAAEKSQKGVVTPQQTPDNVGIFPTSVVPVKTEPTVYSKLARITKPKTTVPGITPL